MFKKDEVGPLNILGIVVEYNPFHYGHLYHLRASIEKTKADVTVAVMSGSFLQRGEPAIADKWTRTRMALQAGIDIIIELPYIYSTQKAEIFSDGAVSLLHSIGCNQLCFGSEAGDVALFQSSVDKVDAKESELNREIQQHLKSGVSYPRAFSAAFQSVFEGDNILDLSQPNNILGYHYVKAIKKLESKLKPYTVKREKAQYHDKELTREHIIASATAIRKKLIEEKQPLEAIYQYLPSYTLQELKGQLQRWGSFVHWEKHFPYLQYRILTSSPEELRNIYECEEGLEYRLLKLITKVSSFQELMEVVKTKRYTWTRIQRLFVHILLNTTKSFMEEYCKPLEAPYIRILGMSEEGRHFLSSRKKELEIPLITRASEWDHPVLQKDVLASQLHSLPYLKNHSLQEEFKAIPIRYDKIKGIFLT
ncbi:putative nucleotidyltransferase [Evansella vedderi]|uniref:tRNA(Met) cytidine acetate ligase n=1 Tax=Evansella vedderi TaxID=38282 RepID=A0ABT9ZS82_9BACI|nr:nucleotidyltransferase [Evansella vedderi]MDQ0253835.1 putative nucleotidyltransferase [Evansella vedderi]